MTIKQQGGIFGRNPTFNEVDVDADLTVDTNTLYVNSSSNEVCVGQLTSINAGKFNVKTDSAHNGISVTPYADNYYSYYGTNAAGSQTFYVRGDGVSNFQGAMTVNSTINNTGNHVISSGNLVINTSGQGIDFSATSDASGSTSELFDDYEEGLFDVTAAASTSGTVTLDYTRLAYTKIGRMVFVNGEIRVGSVSSPVGDITINSLPFTNSGLSQRSSRTSFFVEANSLTGSPTGVVQGNIASGGTAINIRLVNNFSFSSLASYLQAGSAFKFCFAYTAA